MDRQPDVHPAELELTRLLAQHPGTQNAFDKACMASQTEILACSCDLDESGCALFDLKLGSVIWVKPYHGYCLQHPAVCLDVHDNRTQINRLTHPDEVGFWAELCLWSYRAVMELPRGERPAFFAAGTRRLMEKVGTYQPYMMSLRPCIFTADGYPSMIMVKLRRLPHDDVPLFRYMSHYPAGIAETHAYSDRLKNLKMSPRVQEAIELYSNLHSEKQVALKMEISIDSVEDYIHKAIRVMGLTSIRVGAEIWRVISGAYSRPDGVLIGKMKEVDIKPASAITPWEGSSE